jgi:glycosyltransferase involved in cell wall biosynthesis
MTNEILVADTNKTLYVTKQKNTTTDRTNPLPAERELPEILFLTSFPPRQCGIATYSQDLIKALNNKFSHSFQVKVCALESENENHTYTDETKYILNTDLPGAFLQTAQKINTDPVIQIVLIQHEFGFFEKKEKDFIEFLQAISKPVIIVFHTVLPLPDERLKEKVLAIADAVSSVIVMTKSSANILVSEYGIAPEKITVIPHGTHLVTHSNKEELKHKYHLNGRKVLSTFGLLSSGKSIETTLDALPAIIEQNPDVLFLIIGKTHPSVVKKEGERYRNMLKDKVDVLQLRNHVQFINEFLALPVLLEYLQLADIYLFTSKDPNQAVSGTFSYAISCGCPVISTPIPHAREVLQNDAGIIIAFENSNQLSNAVTTLLNDEQLRINMGSNGLHKMASTAWENAAIAHTRLFAATSEGHIYLRYNLPAVNLQHIKKMTTRFGMIQFARINHPDMESGYTLDDNARALIAMCQHYELTSDPADLPYIETYFRFIKHCLQPDGYFLNYVNQEKNFTDQNYSTNLQDSNGRALWALGYLISVGHLLPEEEKELTAEAAATMQKALVNVNKIHSTRAMAFVIKGLYYRNTKISSVRSLSLIRQLANRLVQMYRHEAGDKWQWFESYLTYANSILPEAMLCAWLATGETLYKEIAKTTFDFLLSMTLKGDTIKVISNKRWLHKGNEAVPVADGGEQPIDVAYTILALSKFYDVFKEENYRNKMEISFNWFLGANHLNQVIYNPATGGCYDGLEENYVNLNQGAESTVSYLMARLTIEKTLRKQLTTVPVAIPARESLA